MSRFSTRQPVWFTSPSGSPGLSIPLIRATATLTRTVTGAGAHTTALVAPDQLYVISPAHGGVLVLSDT